MVDPHTTADNMQLVQFTRKALESILSAASRKQTALKDSCNAALGAFHVVMHRESNSCDVICCCCNDVHCMRHP